MKLTEWIKNKYLKIHKCKWHSELSSYSIENENGMETWHADYECTVCKKKWSHFMGVRIKMNRPIF